jgi:hypothetical protein
MDENALDINAAFERMIKNRCIDFGVLDEYFQKKILTRILEDKGAFSEMKRINPFLLDLHPMVPESIIAGNNDAVRKNYSMEKYRKVLLCTYEKIIKTNVRHTIDKKKLLSSFIHSQDFSLLKWGPYGELS